MPTESPATLDQDEGDGPAPPRVECTDAQRSDDETDARFADSLVRRFQDGYRIADVMYVDGWGLQVILYKQTADSFTSAHAALAIDEASGRLVAPGGGVGNVQAPEPSRQAELDTLQASVTPLLVRCGAPIALHVDGAGVHLGFPDGSELVIEIRG